MPAEEKKFYSADLLYGKCDNQPVTVEAVQFHGVKVTKKDALLKEIGHLYSASTLSELIRDCNLTANHLRDVGLMESVTPLIDLVDGKPGKYVVDFIVKEPKSFILGIKAGMTSRGDADYSLNAGKQSFAGRGESVNASYAYTFKGDQTFNFSLLKPLLGWQKYSSIGVTLYRGLAKLPWNYSEVEENGVVLQHSGQLWERKLHHNIKLNTVWRKFCPKEGATFAIREHAGHTLKCSVENMVAYDTRNRTLLADKGVLLKFAQECAGLLGDAAFVKHQFDVQASAPLMLGMFLSASCQFSIIHLLADRSLHLLDRLYVGGPLDVRGFKWNTVGNQVGSSSCIGGATSVIGGNFTKEGDFNQDVMIGSCLGISSESSMKLTFHRLMHCCRTEPSSMFCEPSMPLFPSEMLYAHAFVAGGAVASTQSQHRLRDLSNAYRVSTGMGLTLILNNFVRIELNYVVPLKYMSGDQCSPCFQFGAGLNFL